MRNYINIMRNERSVNTITCNMCGISIDKNEWGYFDPHLSIVQTWEYGSEFDGETHRIDICMNCYKEFMKSLAIKPTDFTE